MTEGEKLFITANYAFNYNESLFEHLVQFDILTQFFEHRNNLQGYVEKTETDEAYIIEGSDVAILVDDLYEGFDNKNIPGVVEKYLHEYQMYEILADYTKPLTEEGEKYKNQLLNT